MSRRNEILAKAHAVTWLPAAAVEAIRLARDPDVSVADLARAIEFDPGLTSNILRMANSAYFGYSGSVHTVRQAIVRLGAIRFVYLVAASSFAPMARQPVRGYNLPPGALWRHSAAAALGTTCLAEALRRRAPDYAFTAGLLHDVGKILLGTFVEVDASRIEALAWTDQLSFDEAERRTLGIDHAEVGAALLARWNLPADIVEVVQWHHQPENFQGADRLVLDLTHISDEICMAEGIGAGADGCRYRPSSRAMADLGVTHQIVESVAAAVISQLNEVESLFVSAAESR
ncbi:MAG: HDOD domain-containing protein [Candidatus Sumerlaeota bacterium]|nr:HDOD domain-containing protein [Candidatus Sumerlaeota bacterium]